MLVALVSRNLLSCEKCTDNLCLRSQASKGSAVLLKEKQGCRGQGARGKEYPLPTSLLHPCRKVERNKRGKEERKLPVLRPLLFQVACIQEGYNPLAEYPPAPSLRQG